MRCAMRVVAFAVLMAVAPAARSQVRVPLVDPRSVAPYVPTPWHVVERMLVEADVSEDDVVFDLGSGDGRILLRAAKDRGARGVGYEINSDLVEEARSAVTAAGVSDQVEIRQGDIFEADLSRATVVTISLLTSAHRRLRPKLLEELRPGTRVACYKWEIPGWNPSKTVTVPVSGSEQPIFVYKVGWHN
jgi:SAM-dependent methyltransferase